MGPIVAPYGAQSKKRRIASSVLIVLAALFIVMALMFRFFTPGPVVKFPLNEYEVMTLQGTNVSYFSTARLTELSGVTMRATYTIKGDVGRARAIGNSNIAVWQAFTAIEDITNHAPFQYTYQRLAFDRKTGELINWRGSVIGKNHNLRLAGQGYVWPFRTQKHDYKVFDTTALKAFTVRYAGTATTDGISTYRFVEVVPNQRIGTQTLPGSLIGMTAPSVTLPEFYSATNTFWVDPVTGDPLKISQNESLTLQDGSGATRLVLVKGTLTTTPASVRTVAAPDHANISKIRMIEVTIPIVSGVLGIVLLAVGLVLLSRRPRPDNEEAPHEEQAPAGSFR